VAWASTIQSLATTSIFVNFNNARDEKKAFDKLGSLMISTL